MRPAPLSKGRFKNLKLFYPSRDISEQHKARRSTDVEALKLCLRFFVTTWIKKKIYNNNYFPLSQFRWENSWETWRRKNNKQNIKAFRLFFCFFYGTILNKHILWEKQIFTLHILMLILRLTVVEAFVEMNLMFTNKNNGYLSNKLTSVTKNTPSCPRWGNKYDSYCYTNMFHVCTWPSLPCRQQPANIPTKLFFEIGFYLGTTKNHLSTKIVGSQVIGLLHGSCGFAVFQLFQVRSWLIEIS